MKFGLLRYWEMMTQVRVVRGNVNNIAAAEAWWDVTVSRK